MLIDVTFVIDVPLTSQVKIQAPEEPSEAINHSSNSPSLHVPSASTGVVSFAKAYNIAR